MRSFFLSLFILPAILYSQNPAHNNKGYVDNMLYVKFTDDSNIQLSGKNIELDFPGCFDPNSYVQTKGYWTRVHKISQEALTKMRRNAEKNLNKQLPDPNSEFHFHLYNPKDLENIQQLLAVVSNIENISKVPIPFNAIAPDYQGGEHYITSTTSGIEAELFWSTYNNRGAGIKVCDIEYGFNGNHVDLPTVTIVGPPPQDPFAGGGVDHGTGVLGEIASLNDGIGTTGIASDCQLFFAGAFTDSTYDLEAAITYAISVLGPGDVILLEQQIAGPHYTGSGQFGLVPVEWYEPYFNAIQLAVGQNIIVVEAAGNGEQNLDDGDYANGNGGHFPFLVGNESGAIIVGAGHVSDSLPGGGDVARSRMWYSNYGYAVDVQGNGQAVTTTGYGDLFSADGVDSYYTDGFGGTSSASPIVTGAIVLLQSLYKDTTGNILTPPEMLSLLQSTGKPQQAGDYDLSYQIGPLPNVMQAFYLIYVSAGLDENVKPTFMVFPNPNQGNFNIFSLSENFAPENLFVINMVGQPTPYTIQPVSDDLYRMEVNAEAGVYFVNYHISGKNFSQKIIISQ
jgi:hypothetical protein